MKQFNGHCCMQFNELQAVGLFLGLDGASTSIYSIFYDCETDQEKVLCELISMCPGLAFLSFFKCLKILNAYMGDFDHAQAWCGIITCTQSL